MPHEDLTPGTHLTSPRWAYVHHGIYAGNGRVIHYRGFNRPLVRGPVEEVSLERFARGRRIDVQPHVAPRFAGHAAVERARSRIGEDRYRFWTNNCEHFCEWCLSGRSRSPQVEAWQARLRRVAMRLVRPLQQLARLSLRLKSAAGASETSLT
jgi:hypothetical protein